MSDRVVTCPHCSGRAVFEDSAAVYRGKSHGMIWHCRPCGAYVGVHKAGSWRWEKGVRVEHRGDEPLGTLADAKTRRARKRAHEVFDGLWQKGFMQRAAAYAWLQGALQLSPERCHIAFMTAAQCDRVIKLCESWSPNKKAAKGGKKAGRRDSKPGVATPRRDRSLPDCGCTHVPQWEHCPHSEAVETEAATRRTT